MDRFYYRDILEQNLQPSINDFQLDQRYIFIYGNNPQHNSELIKKKRIEALVCPSDLFPQRIYETSLSDESKNINRRIRQNGHFY